MHHAKAQSSQRFGLRWVRHICALKPTYASSLAPTGMHTFQQHFLCVSLRIARRSASRRRGRCASPAEVLHAGMAFAVKFACLYRKHRRRKARKDFLRLDCSSFHRLPRNTGEYSEAMGQMVRWVVETHNYASLRCSRTRLPNACLCVRLKRCYPLSSLMNQRKPEKRQHAIE